MLTEFFNALSNREKALLVWIFVAFGLMMLKSNLRGSVSNVVRSLTVKNLVVLQLCFIAYVAAIVSLLASHGYWDTKMLKDTCLWTFGAFVLLMGARAFSKPSDFRKLALDTLKWTVLMEFLIATYTFSFWVEFTLTPFLFILGACQAIAQYDKKYAPAAKLFNAMIIVFGFGTLFFATYKAMHDSENFLTLTNLKSFLFPVFMSLTFIPFVYAFTLYMAYENILIRLPRMVRDIDQQKKVRRQLFQVGNLNLTKVCNISRNIFLAGIDKQSDIAQKLEEISDSNYKYEFE
jgi:hypothetical protein